LVQLCWGQTPGPPTAEGADPCLKMVTGWHKSAVVFLLVFGILWFFTAVIHPLSTKMSKYNGNVVPELKCFAVVAHFWRRRGCREES